MQEASYTEPATVDDPTKHCWDVIVVGTGVGGATLGYALARAGRKVLFCEQGGSYLDASSLRGQYGELYFPKSSAPQSRHVQLLQRSGRWHESIRDDSSPAARYSIPFLGVGTGGSSALYGMAMERFFPADFTPGNQHRGAEGSSLPERWPVSYEDMRPYYEEAERLYRVRGTADPCRGSESFAYVAEPPHLNAGAELLFGAFRHKGLRPYRLPLACEYLSGCRGCQGYLCPNPCKNDSARMCLFPALARYGATLLDHCRVLHLEASPNEVTGVVCSWRGQRMVLRSSLVVLAAGALQTPALLLKSRSRLWPLGLANGSDQVGRNLMRHCVDLYAVFTGGRHPQQEQQFKEIAFNDFYDLHGSKLGSVQSFGALPPASVLVEGMIDDLGHGVARAILGQVPIKSVLRWLFGLLAQRSTVLATIMEDLPYSDNRVVLEPNGIGVAFRYRLRDYERKRIDLFRSVMRETIAPFRYLLLKQAEANKMLAHSCGTCRFGEDARSSVLNKYNRAHDMTNLYVVDSSFFPSSGGINPSLTIAANALRVAEYVVHGDKLPSQKAWSGNASA